MKRTLYKLRPRNLEWQEILLSFLLLVFVIPASVSGSNTTTAENNFYVDEDVKELQQMIPSTTINSSTFHLFSHGKPGALLIEGEWKNAEMLAEWIKNNNLVSNKQQLNIYGCNFARGPNGQQAVKYLESTLDVQIAASDDITGIDGDWDLEIGKSEEVIKLTHFESN